MQMAVLAALQRIEFGHDQRYISTVAPEFCSKPGCRMGPGFFAGSAPSRSGTKSAFKE